MEVIHHGQRCGPCGSPTALNTEFRWVLAGNAGQPSETELITTHFISVSTRDDLLRRFWEVEEQGIADCTLSLEEHSTLEHFDMHHSRVEQGRIVVPLPKRTLTTKH